LESVLDIIQLYRIHVLVLVSNSLSTHHCKLVPAIHVPQVFLFTQHTQTEFTTASAIMHCLRCT